MTRHVLRFASSLTVIAVCVLASVGCATARADHETGSYRTNASQAYYDYARVVDVDPIVTTRYVSTPREECRVEHSGYYREVEHPPHHGAAPWLLGSLIGGVIGHQFGDGRARKVSTVAGALLGGSVAHQAAHNRYPTRTTYDYVPRTERHCTVIEDVTEVQEIDGYNVTYRYKGQTFVKRTETHPGDRIRIRVEVTPDLAAATPASTFRFRSSTLG